jgi:hypothetical protein
VETLDDDSAEDNFDNVDEDIAPAAAEGPEPGAAGPVPVPDERAYIPPERRSLPMPSSCLENGHPLRKIELGFRKDQAACYLKALREVVAQKSFHYSHVIRVAPSKGTRTRARTVIAKLNVKIASYSRIYARCRMTMVRLGADDQTLRTFRILQREDVKASTAILDPNERGASSLRLSWIWHLSGFDNSSGSLHECWSNLSFFGSIQLILFALAVQRVHWLRARAQKSRWNEEVILLQYEMEWAVRYFLHHSHQWRVRAQAAEVTAGQAAYGFRQAASWQSLAGRAEAQFSKSNKEYIRLIK